MVLRVADLHPNEGQLEGIGVHANPRIITDEEYRKLVKSLREDDLTGVLQEKVIKHNGEWIVLDGNMRLRALREVGIEEVQCLVVPEDADAQTIEKIIILSNSNFGQWDMDALANWDAPLADLGVDMPTCSENMDGEEKIKGVEQFAEILNEENNYIVLQFRSEVDWIQAVQIFDLQPRLCGSYRKDGKIIKKNQNSGLARVLDGPTALNKLVRI